MGRHTKYRDTFPKKAYEYALQGLTDIQIAKNLRISISNFYEYRLRYPEFMDALKRGKAPIDAEVENKLLKRAMGYDYEEKTTEVEVGRDGEAKPTRVRTVKKHVPPDVTAQIFWLKNRRPKDWSDRRVNELSGVDGKDLMPEPITIEIVDKTDEAEDDKGI